MSEIRMVEPTDPMERQKAIRMCRANARLDIDTGTPINNDEAAQRQWEVVESLLPYAKWIWMWNHGRKEWDPTARSETGESK